MVYARNNREKAFVSNKKKEKATKKATQIKRPHTSGPKLELLMPSSPWTRLVKKEVAMPGVWDDTTIQKKLRTDQLYKS